MSLESAKEFTKKLMTEKGFRDKFASIADPAARKAAVAAAGYSFTKDEMHEALQHVQKPGELSDAELEGVAGGGASTTISAVTSVVSAITAAF
jgi:predicted ribosomally synthesized peptide with nif11-like leader